MSSIPGTASLEDLFCGIERLWEDCGAQASELAAELRNACQPLALGEPTQEELRDIARRIEGIARRLEGDR